MKAGILSDTHDLLRPEVIDALQAKDIEMRLAARTAQQGQEKP